jgi:hypothetical protein
MSKETPIQISLAQRFFACGWLLRGWLVAFSLGLPLAVLLTLNLNVFAAGWYVWLLLAGLSLLLAFAGFLLGTVLFSGLIAPILELRTRLNGGPFLVGDMVVVLGGKYRGRRGCVHAVGQGVNVSVEFSEENKASFEFGQHQLQRL